MRSRAAPGLPMPAAPKLTGKCLPVGCSVTPYGCCVAHEQQLRRADPDTPRPKC